MTRKNAETARTKELRRSRWPVVCGALVLLWCAWGYCRGEGLGLFLVTAGVAAAAAAVTPADASFIAEETSVIWIADCSAAAAMELAVS